MYKEEEMEQQHKLNVSRDTIVFGGGSLLIIFALIQQVRAGRQVMLVTVCILPAILGGFLIAFGAYSRRLQRWMHRTEERLNRLEKEPAKGVRSQQSTIGLTEEM